MAVRGMLEYRDQGANSGGDSFVDVAVPGDGSTGRATKRVLTCGLIRSEGGGVPVAHQVSRSGLTYFGQILWPRP